MRIANLNDRAVLLEGTRAIDIETASAGRFGADISALYAEWDAFVAWAAGAGATGATGAAGGTELDLAAPQAAGLGAVSPRPVQVFAIGLNYAAHAAEGGRDVPKAPATFTKFPTCLAAPFSDVAVAGPTMDWEVELVVVIGRRAHRVAAADAWSVVAGLTVGQDYSERTVQNASGGHFSMGKSFPGFGPTGPWMVTPDELGVSAAQPRLDVELSCTVSGEEMQRSRTSMMVFPVPVLIEYLSAITPLLPGDLIFTGTPEGVGFRRTPPRALQPGDVVESTIEGIGTIRNRMI
jgi:2,4-didehydro-3-deoxy-L-rhamnonate hydrolase